MAEDPCSHHSERSATGTCHACRQPFCAECLTQGWEYDYCGDAPCAAALAREEAAADALKTKQGPPPPPPRQMTEGQRRALSLAGVAILFGVLGVCVATGADRETTKAAWMASIVVLVLLGAFTLPNHAR